MSYYILLDNNIVRENIPEFNPDLPGIPIKERYAPDFLARCVESGEPVQEGWVYDPASGTFSEPLLEPEPEQPEPLPIAEPAPIERIAAALEFNNLLNL